MAELNSHSLKTQRVFSRSNARRERLSVSRRKFLKMMGGAGALGATHGALTLFPGDLRAGIPQSALNERRNLIVFTTDQQQALRWFPPGWEEANLPGLTRLRNRGLSFHRAYTNTAMCTPSRTTLFTGLYPAQHGSFDTLSEGMSQSMEEHQLDPSIPNIATILKAEGYDVVWKGKWHLSKGVEHPDGSHSDDDIRRYGMDGWNSPDAGGDAKLPNYGGGTVNNDGRFFDGSTWQAPVGDPQDPESIFTQADGPPDPAHVMDSAMKFLRDRIENPGTKPFCLIICLINPHDVLGCPGLSTDLGGNGTYLEGGYVGREDGSSPWSEQTGPLAIELPPTKDENLVLNHKPDCQPAFIAASAGLGPVPTDPLKLKYVNFYGNLIKLVDRYLCRMLDLLDGEAPDVDANKARALRDKSWIFFSSDHGDMAMSHGGMRQKSFQAYEESVNIPLIWSNPVDFPAGKDCQQLVSHVDFLPTLCGLLDIDTTSLNLRGVDYSPLILDPDGPPVQDSILFTYDDIWCGQEAAGNSNGIVNPPNRLQALIEKDYKYVLYFDGEGQAASQDEFYDLRSHADGGTDTALGHGLGSSGKALEYTNYSKWAEDRRTIKKATIQLQAKRDAMELDLAAAVDTKLEPLPPQAAVQPENFAINIYRWTGQQGEAQAALQLSWLSRSNTRYQLQESLDLKNPSAWQDIGDFLVGNNGPLWIDQPMNDKAFYRLVWSPAD